MNLTKPISDLVELLPEYHTLAETLAAARIKRAHKFVVDVQAMPYEIFEGGAHYADQLAEFGLLQLPFSECVFLIGPYNDDEYERSATKDCAYVIVAWTDGDIISFRCYNFWFGDATINSAHATFHIPRTMGHIDWGKSGGAFVSEPSRYCTVDDNPTGEHRFCQHGARPGDFDGTAVDYQVVAGGIPSMLLYSALGCLNAQGVVTNEAKAPKFINEQRRKKGKGEIFSYRIITVDPAILRMPGVRGHGTHASPRLHWRRGHRRTLPNGRVVLVKACLVGDPERGFILHDYRLRAEVALTSATHPDVAKP